MDTSYVNCATQQQIGMAVSSSFYQVDSVQWDAKVAEFSAPAGGYTSLRLNPEFWTEKGNYLATDQSHAWSSADGPGTLTSHSFVISDSSLAFQSGYGGDGSSVKLMTQADDGTFSRMRKQFTTTQHEIDDVLWDVSGLINEAAVIVIENAGAGHRMLVNNIRMFDSMPGCLSDSITIEPVDGGLLNIMGTTYGPIYRGGAEQKITHKELAGVETMYCAMDTAGSVSTGGVFASNFPAGFEYHELGMDHLPSCMVIRKLVGENAYQISVEAGKRRFLFSHSSCSADSEDSLHCVYSTQQPRCIEYTGLLTDVVQADMHCVESLPLVSCIETALSLKCPLAAEEACGAKKIQRDLFECCSTGGTGKIASCIGHTRRLGETIRFSASEVVDMVVAQSCARACHQSEKKCHGWRVDELSNECKVSLKCYPASYPEVKSLELSNKRWNLINNGNPFDGMTVTVRQAVV